MSPAVSIRRSLMLGLCLALALTTVIDLAILVVPIYDMQLYDRVLMSRNMDTLAMLSVACVVGLLFYAALDYLRSATFVAIASTLARRMQVPALREGIRFAAAGDKRTGPELVRAIHELQSFLSSGAVAVPLDAICAPMFVTVLFLLHPAFGWLSLVGITMLIFLSALTEWLVAPELKRAEEQRRQADYKMSRSLADAELVDGLGMLPAIAARWSGRRAWAMQGSGRAAGRAQVIAGASHLIRLLLQAGVMALGAVLIIRGDTTPGSLMGANLLLNKCLGPFDHLVDSCRSWVIARKNWNTASALLRPSLRSATTARPAGIPAEPGLYVDGLSFSLPDGRVLLRDICFDVQPGTLVLLSGPNGCGKTTLMRILAGVLEPTEGTVAFDGARLPGASKIGYLPQSVSLLDASVADTIGHLVPNVGDVVLAARRAEIHELIGRMARGYDTQLTGNGANLSGGMRQRIGLARALYHIPKLLLLDEPDASLDAEGSAALLRVLRHCCDHGSIAIVISHRPALRQAADVVIALREGCIVPEQANPPGDPRQLETA